MDHRAVVQAATGLITREQELADLAERLLAEGLPVGYDIETGYEGESRESAQLHPEENFIAGFSFTNSVSWARYVPIQHDSGTNLDPEFAARAMWPLAKAGLLVPHGAKFELRCSSRWFDAHVPDAKPTKGYFTVRSCTMLEAYAEGSHRSVGLKPLTKETFGHTMTEIMELFPAGLTQKEQKAIRFSVLDQHDPKVISYACEDAVYALANHLRRYAGAGGYPAISNPVHPQHFIYAMEMALLPIVCGMEETGIRCDWPFWREAAVRGREFQQKLGAEISSTLTELAGEPIALNIASHKQLSDVLYGKLGYPVRRRSVKTGAPSTDKVALKPLAKQYPVVQQIVDWKQIAKLCGTYLEKYERNFTYAPDGMTHPNHLQHGVPAGRFAVSDWPYQQSPKKYHYELKDGSSFDFNFRDGVICPDGYYGLGFDLSQAELRVIAGEAGETALLEVFAQGGDPHRLTAALMLGLQGEVSDENRAVGKAQPLDEPILTPLGWRRMGDLRPGDMVIGSDGKPTAVTGVFPQGTRMVYRVTTSDGAATECCGEHLWTVRNINTKSGKWVTKPLTDLVRAGLRSGNGYRFVLPLRPKVAGCDSSPLPLDPYVLGLLLGDGGFTQRVMFCSVDYELLDAVAAEQEARGGRVSLTVERSGLRVIHLRAGTPYDRKGNPVKLALGRLGLMGLRGEKKFIPLPYLQADSESRLALLQGLLDTDGNVLASGAEFKVASEQLARGVQELARSLGGWASLRACPGVKTAFHGKGVPKPVWKVYLRLPAEMCPFRLKRKVANWKPPRYVADQRIVSVEEVMEKEVQCISVMAADGLYVTRDYVVTHNTMNFALGHGLSDERGRPGRSARYSP